jgi:hypothetical protein
MGSPPQMYAAASDTNGNNIDADKMAASRDPTSVCRLCFKIFLPDFLNIHAKISPSCISIFCLLSQHFLFNYMRIKHVL